MKNSQLASNVIKVLKHTQHSMFILYSVINESIPELPAKFRGMGAGPFLE